MTETGFFKLDRGIWDHDLFKDDPQPFSKREAWIWLISNANWKPARKRVKTKVYDIDRGQMMTSFRDLAKAWRWSEGRVRRYFDSLIFEAMVEVTSDRFSTHITICNYEQYQISRRTDEHAVEYANGHASDAQATHKPSQPVEIVAEKHPEEGEERKKIKSIEQVAAEARAKSTISQEAYGVARTIAEIEGRDFQFCVGHPWWAQSCFNKGASADQIIEAVRRGMATQRKKGRGPPSVNYYDTILPEVIAEQNRPIPVLSVDTPQIFEFNAREKKNGFVQAPNGARHRANGKQPSIRELCDAAADAFEAVERGGTYPMGSPAQRPPEHQRSSPSDWGDVIDVSQCEATGSWGLRGEDEGRAAKVPA